MKQIALTLCVLLAGIGIGCGDNKGQDAESCTSPGDEDGNGLADCNDPACVGTSACPPVCGNGRVEDGETCDDGNTASGDGCDSNCKPTGCGNGVQTMNEGCDDGNTASGDGCDANCTLTDCGNGVMTTGEACDDGNATSGDGCDNNCTATACGNGVQTMNEACDDGNVTSDDGCDANCTPTGCGNGVLTTGEICDDGNATSGDGCDANCTVTACGNGVMTTGEACDDGNATSGDGCDANCTVTACGNGIATPGEACDDGNATNGDGCDNNCTMTACGNGIATTGEACDDGNATNGDGCDNNCTMTACGNGIATPGEACDDGNATSGDGCDANCTLTACGNGIATTGEACDDGNATSGDGCDVNCTLTACGNGIPTTGEECDDGNANNTDGCTTSCIIAICGDSEIDGPEVCDDGNTTSGDGCDANCTLTACGNGIQTTGEACDDGNAGALDGCSPACVVEPLEVEPNEDGSISTGGSGISGNDFGTANPDANGAFSGPITIRGALTPVGDEDIFVFTNTTGTAQTVKLDIWNPALGINVPCGTTIDTGLQIKNAAGTSLASNDDRNGAADRCSTVTFGLLAGASVYAQVMEFGDNAVIGGYAIVATYTPVVCGDGAVGTGEQCDDGNVTGGDGCGATCQIEVVCGDGLTAPGEQCDDGNVAGGDGCSAICQVEVTAEVEPNDTFTDAAASTLQITGDVTIQGAITPIADQDAYQLVVAAATVVRFETFTSIFDCNTTIDLRLFDALGMPIIADTAGQGVATCGEITFFLDPGTYFVRVEERGNNAMIASYFLAVDYQTDRGAEAEPANTSGVNETIATAAADLVNGREVYVFGDHTLAGDVDVYAITVPGGTRLRAEIIEGDRAIETCESNGIDSRLTLFNQAGVQLVDDDDDGRGFCSLIDGTGASPLDAAARNATTAPQTFYLMVRQSGSAAGAGMNFIYRLQVSLR